MGAKAGIGIGVVFAVVLILALLAFILYQRKQNAKLKKAQNSTGTGLTFTGVPELGGKGLFTAALPATESGSAAERSSRVSELQGGLASPVSPVSRTRSPEWLDNAVAEAAAPLSMEEKKELEGRRRAAELSGVGREIAIEKEEGERGELEARRTVYEMA